MKPVMVPTGETEAMVTLEMTGNAFNQNLNLVVSGISRIPRTKKIKAMVYKALSAAIIVETPKRTGKR